jgi:hypothetical protein
MACAMRCRRLLGAGCDSAVGVEYHHRGQEHRVEVPWCSRGFTPPRLWLSECTQPKPFWKAMAPCMLALIICSSGPPGRCRSRVARSMCAQPRCQTVQRNAVGRRVDGRRHEGLHAVRDRVHAGGGCQQRRQAEGERRGRSRAALGIRCQLWNPACGRRRRSGWRRAPPRCPCRRWWARRSAAPRGR